MKLKTTKRPCPTCSSPREVVDGAHLQEIRGLLGLSLRAMGELLGVSHALVDDMEKMRRGVSSRVRERYEKLEIRRVRRKA